MDALSEGDVLRVWESGREGSAVDRALAILAAAAPETDPGELAAWSLGRRDARLLRVHRSTFGPTLHAFAECPACDAPLELELDAGVLSEVASRPGGGERSIRSGPYTLRFRPVDSHDLAVAARAGDAAGARRVLLARCVTECREGDRSVPVDGLPDTVIGELARALDGLDPGADLTVELACPECGHRWSPGLDPATYVWAELAAAARRILHEVDTLARAYGWTEPEILALGPGRRAAYMELAS
jgi:hypothetical protein